MRRFMLTGALVVCCNQTSPPVGAQTTTRWLSANDARVYYCFITHAPQCVDCTGSLGVTSRHTRATNKL